jgi:hypothetical protein
MTFNTPDSISDGGFCIVIHPDELTVTKDSSAWKVRTKSAVSRVITTVLFVLFVLVVGVNVFSESTGRGLLFLGIIAALTIPSMLYGWLRGLNNIHCTCNDLEVTRIVRGHPTGTWRFPRDLVKQVRFAPVSYSRYGSTNALVFTVEGKRVQILRGIEIPEAQIVLSAMKRLGFDVLIDVAMPMAAEMALERRGKLRARPDRQR